MHPLERAYYDIYCFNGSKYYPYNHPRCCRTCAFLETNRIRYKTDYTLEWHCLKGGHRYKLISLSDHRNLGCYGWRCRISNLLELFVRMLPFAIYNIPEDMPKVAGKKRGRKPKQNL